MESAEKELIIKAQNGDQFSFEQLIYNYDRAVLSIAMKYARDNDDAKDIYQEVFIRVFRGLNKFEFRSEFATWLFRITTNVCITYKTRKKEQLMVSLQNEFEDEQTGYDSVDLASKERSPEEITSGNDIHGLI